MSTAYMFHFAQKPLVYISSYEGSLHLKDCYKIFFIFLILLGGARGEMVIVVGNRLGDTSSNPERDWLHFT